MSTSSTVEKTGELAQRATPTPFLTKTYDMVDDPSSNDMISWNENGNAFVVWKPAEFARDLLPKYFKHNNFSSFIRQLNTYGFRKIVADRWEFANDYFRRDEKSLLGMIHRRKIAIAPSTPPAAMVTTATPLSALPMTTSSPGNSSEELGGSSNSSPPIATIMKTDLVEENVRLKEQNSNLRCEIDNLRSLCSNVVTMMSNFMSNQSEMYNCGSELKEVEGDNKDLQMEDHMCPRLFGVSIGAKRMRRYSNEEQQDDDMQEG